ncbi:DUF2000 family protein [Lachnospiraceae bacterium 62-35]
MIEKSAPGSFFFYFHIKRYEFYPLIHYENRWNKFKKENGIGWTCPWCLPRHFQQYSDLTVVDFSDLAQGCKTHDEFIEKMKLISETDLNYFGLAICGAKKKVNKLTGSMPLLR